MSKAQKFEDRVNLMRDEMRVNYLIRMQSGDQIVTELLSKKYGTQPRPGAVCLTKSCSDSFRTAL